MQGELTTETITIRENKPDRGDFETLTVSRDIAGQIREVVWREEADEPDPRRYQPVRWSEVTYRWRPQLKLWDRIQRANDLYPGKPDHVERDRVATLPAELVAVLKGEPVVAEAENQSPVCGGTGEVEGTGGGMRPCPECVRELSPLPPTDEEDD